MNLPRRAFLATLTLAAMPHRGLAQPAGTAPIKLVVGFAGGGSTDAMARIIAERLGQRIGRQVVVENNGGASGRLAAEQVKRADPDGLNLLVGNIGMIALAPVTFKNLSYDPLRDFAPAIRAADFQMALAASPHTGATTLAGLVAWLKANGSQANIGAPLQASLSHLTALRFAEASTSGATVIIYRGSALALPDMLGGRLAGAVAAVGDFIEQHRAGAIRIVAVSGASRSPSLPEVATFAEQGIGDLGGNGWNGFLLPRGTAPELVGFFNREIAATIAEPTVAEKLAGLGFVRPAPNTPAEFAASIAAEIEAWRPVVKAAGLEQ